MKHKIRNVLVLIDFSRRAVKTLHVTAPLCAKKDAHLTMLYVLTASEFMLPENKLTPILLPELIGVANESLRKQASSLSKSYKVSVDLHVAWGDTTEEALRFIRNNNVDVVVSGIAEDHNASASTKGSIALRVAKRTSCPVLSLDHVQKYNPSSSVVSLIQTKIKLHEQGIS
jgi:nucleotide-binding universal stress UspA family protein